MTKRSSDLFSPAKAPSHRQKRVAEEIRHLLSQAILRGELPTQSLREQSITITEVSVSPDLRHATVLVMPLGGNEQQQILQELKEVGPVLRHYLAKNMNLRQVPELRFRLDDQFEKEQYMNELFNRIKKPSSDEPSSEND